MISAFKLAPTDAFEPLTFAIRKSRQDVIGVACVDREGGLGPSEFYRPSDLGSPGAWASFAKQSGAVAVIVACRSVGEGGHLSQIDSEFITRAKDVAGKAGLLVFAFLFVQKSSVSFVAQDMIASTRSVAEADCGYAVARKIS